MIFVGLGCSSIGFSFVGIGLGEDGEKILSFFGEKKKGRGDVSVCMCVMMVCRAFLLARRVQRADHVGVRLPGSRAFRARVGLFGGLSLGEDCDE